MSYVQLGRARARMRFSRVEVVQILVAVGAMTVAFFLALANGLSGLPFLLSAPDAGLLVSVLLVSSFVAVVTAFLLHELAHKAVAQRYGCFAEFRYYPMGLVLGVLTAAFGFLFAMPGAVMISGYVGPRENVRISAAGPGTNMALAAVFLALAVGLGTTGGPTSNLVKQLVASIAYVNLFLGGFNLIPFPPLDGSKVFAFDKVLWVLMVAGLGGLYVAGVWLRAF
ncbi:MAG TPA: site-2 protease family protein [Thermoplasmata archaeon]|nr:site-2 protease family protein [Thermoplasmata archaeon]